MVGGARESPDHELSKGGESRSGKHNPKVVGSNPTPATENAGWSRKDQPAFLFYRKGFEPTTFGIFFRYNLCMNTKQRGDIAEQAAVLAGLKQGWSVLRPVGDNLPYDLVFEKAGSFIKIQVKCAWLDIPSQNYVVDNRRTKTNRRQMIRENYRPGDFDFALVYLPEKEIFYIYPLKVFISFGSEIHMVETEKRQRRPRSYAYRDAWALIAPFNLQATEMCKVVAGNPTPATISKVRKPLIFRRFENQGLFACNKYFKGFPNGRT